MKIAIMTVIVILVLGMHLGCAKVLRVFRENGKEWIKISPNCEGNRVGAWCADELALRFGAPMPFQDRPGRRVQ